MTDNLRALVSNAIDKEEPGAETGEDDARQDQALEETYHGAPMAMDDGKALEPTQNFDGRGALRNKWTRDKQAQFYAGQFSIPEWMVDVPRDLNGHLSTEGGGWFVMPRPEGKRCLMVASGGITVTRLTNGDVLHRFPSALPNGSPRAKGPRDGWTMLDCIYSEARRTYFVLDLLCWRKMELYDCTCEFRLFFLRSKFEEEMGESAAAGAAGAAGGYLLEPLPYFECDSRGLRRAYGEFVPFIRDGLLFWSKQSYVEMGPSPLVLLWKDMECSRYFLRDTQQQQQHHQSLSCVLSVQKAKNKGGGENGYPLSTLDGLVVGRATLEEVNAWGLGQTQDGGAGGEREEEERMLIRFWYEGATEDEKSNEQRLHGLRFDRKCSPKRAMADAWSKLLFHSRAKEGGRKGGAAVTFDMLLQAVEGPVYKEVEEEVEGMMC